MVPKDGNSGTKNCLLLSVTPPNAPEPNDYELAHGEGKVRKYLGSDTINSAVEGMTAERFKEIYANGNGSTFLPNLSERDGFVQLFYCDTGAGGGMKQSYAESPKWKLPL